MKKKTKKNNGYVHWKRDVVVKERIDKVEFGWDCEDVVI